MLLFGYLRDVFDYIVGDHSVSQDFRQLLRHYNLTRKDGDVIRDNLFAYDLVIPRDDNENIVYEVWAIEEFKRLFINYFKKKFPSEEMDLEYLNNYKVNEEFLKEKAEFVKVNNILEEYMGEDKLSNQYLNDLSEYNLLSSYFEITLKFLSTPLEVFEEVCDIREYILNYLKETSRKDELDGKSPQTIEEILDFIITNSNKDFIDFIYNHAEFNKEGNDSRGMLNFISTYFNLENKPDLMMECFNSKYNDLKYSYVIKNYNYKKDEYTIYAGDDEKDKKATAINLDYDDISNYKFGAFTSLRFDALIILNELREKVQKNYDEIISIDFKDRLVETKEDCYILDEIDDYSLNFLENLFLKEEYDDLIRYYNLSEENGIEIKDKCYAYCFEYKEYDSKLIRNYHIVDTFYRAFRWHYNFLMERDRKSLDKFFNYSNYKKLDELTKEYQIKRYFKYHLKDEELCEFLHDELIGRDLLDYWGCLELYKNGTSLDSKEKIKKYLDDFEDSYDFSKPQSIMESNRYLVENTSREFIDEVYNSNQDDMIRLHFTLGMVIRNDFGINDRSNSKLLGDISESKYATVSLWSDDDSGVILNEFYDYVQENYDEIIKNTTFKNTINMGKYILK
ncbi:MAG: hypothetical protein IJ104_04110 [Methanobrevibacter sp.]|nr:hypothetical protein [Methanobrevibacter sp.]